MSEPLKPKVVAFVPAKGSSERIDNKNARLLDGRPLVVHTLDKLLKCRSVDEVYLDTESDDIARLARHLPVRIMKRNRFLASNGTDGHALFMNEVRHVDADIYVQALCTAPFVLPETVDQAVDILTRDARYDSVALVRKEKQYRWSDGEPVYGYGRIPNSVELPPTIIEAMSLYVVRREAALATNRRFGNRVHLLESSPVESVDVNTPEDFELAESIASGRRERERVVLRTLRTELTSPVLADILDRLGVHGAVRGLSPLTPDARILGRAKTLWAAHCQLVGDGGRRVLFAGLGEGGGSFTLAGLGARAPGEKRLAPDLLEDLVQQSPAGGLADAADQGAQHDGERDPVGIARFLAGPVPGGPDPGELHQLVDDEQGI